MRERVNPDICLAIVERCAALGAKVITFGGGDPFMYGGFRDLLQKTADLGIRSHVDTNALGLTPSDYKLLEDTRSLLALPLDGPNSQVHLQMRKMENHFDVVIGHLDALRERSVRVKINTVVSTCNYDSILKLAELLNSYRINLWSLYQFWPLHDALANNASYQLTSIDFDSLMKLLLSRKHSFSIEQGPITERHGTYFFVSHTGLLYINHPSDLTKYLTVGSVFDDKAIADWRRLTGSSIRPRAVSRYG